jgi:hypothetical protein
VQCGAYLRWDIGQQAVQQKLAPFVYHECFNTPGLWYHDTCLILFTIVVDNFGVKYINDNDVNHLIASLKMMYKLTEDWTGDLYCSIAHNWDYANRTVDIYMPGYINKKKYKNTDILSQTGRKNAHTCQSPKSLVPKNKPPSHPMIHQNWMQRVLNASNKLWEAFCITHELWT